ncbi:N-acetyltransferase [Actinocatenispora thailandica]|uniref:N-acetyltransferase n=1 Tax=Actinocatenispora thailandica TaxID=227318 RepID=A0A7R7DNR0_9ACTN|nr:GNAT family N-acetyltransferase [Actinocatenispora thailandica]BCJ35100.1 N-acetyltransferase [Actinocatenispora thailandica]
MTDLTVRRARREDVTALVALIAADQLGAGRETPDDPAPYLAAFAAIDADPNQYLAVAELNGEPIGTLQLTYLPGLSHRGGWRAQIEAVRIAEAHRGSGLGSALIEWAIGRARERGCRMVQLTSNATRDDAHRFYTRLGFVPSHVGFKLPL